MSSLYQEILFDSLFLFIVWYIGELHISWAKWCDRKQSGQKSVFSDIPSSFQAWFFFASLKNNMDPSTIGEDDMRQYYLCIVCTYWLLTLSS